MSSIGFDAGHANGEVPMEYHGQAAKSVLPLLYGPDTGPPYLYYIRSDISVGAVIYTLALTFFIIPVTIRAYLSLKNGKFPLPYFQNNVVVNRIKLRKSIGVLSPIVFWVFHTLWVIGMLAIEAWLAALAAIVYMVVSPLLSGQIKAKQVGVIQETVAPGIPETDQA
jgi:hypothetical protein